MPAITSFTEAVRAGLHWAVGSYLERGASAQSATKALIAGRFMGGAVAKEYASEFVQLVQHAKRAGMLYSDEDKPGILDIPYAVGFPTNQRFVTQGIITYHGPEGADSGDRLKATMPFTQESDRIKSLQEIADDVRRVIERDLTDIIAGGLYERRQRTIEQIVDLSDEAPEYDIAPLFVWRTS